MTAFVRAHQFSFTTLLLAAALVAGACGGDVTNSLEPAPSIPTSDQPFPRTVIDDASIEVTIASEPQRIVALTPASVEALAAWGLSDRVVAVAACTCLPSALATRPQVADYTGTNVEAIIALNPDLVFVGGSGFTPDDDGRPRGDPARRCRLRRNRGGGRGTARMGNDPRRGERRHSSNRW
ncbi:hypothetical protein EBU60_01750 [bacterium]|nr:hypothetical protein [bacterium]